MSEVTVIFNVEIYRGERGDPGQETVTLPLTATLADLMEAARGCRAEKITILPQSTRWPTEAHGRSGWPEEGAKE